MKERPILFSGPMVRAILDGRKTQTRRIVKPHANAESARENYAVPNVWVFQDKLRGRCFDLQCPYGKPGDRLWVRETFEICRETCLWEVEEYDLFEWEPEIYGAPEKSLSPKCPRGGHRAVVCYRADNKEDPISRWHPSIHMPRWASRITLEITAIRVERLQSITLGDIVKEGLAKSIYDFKPVQDGFRQWQDLWDSINDKSPAAAIRGDAHPWESNPWVWVIEFKRL